VLRRDRLQAIVNEHPEVLLEFIKNLSERLRSMDEKLESAPVAEPASTPQAAPRP
jgi:CRP-like cAMP-binding protein